MKEQNCLYRNNHSSIVYRYYSKSTTTSSPPHGLYVHFVVWPSEVLRSPPCSAVTSTYNFTSALSYNRHSTFVSELGL